MQIWVKAQVCVPTAHSSMSKHDPSVVSSVPSGHWGAVVETIHGVIVSQGYERILHVSQIFDAIDY